MPERKRRKTRTSHKGKKRTQTDVGIKADALVAEGMWKRTFDSVPDSIVILDKEHRIVQINKSMAQRLGTTPERCVGLNCFQCVHKLDAPPSFCPHSLTLADGKEHVAEIHEPNLGGDFVVSTTPLFDNEGEIIGSVHVARDVTERKKAEEVIKSLSRFPAENPNIVMRISKDGNLLHCNDASSPILNEWKCQVEQPVPNKWLQLVTDVFKSGDRKEVEEEHGGRTFLLMMSPIAEEGYVNVYGRDITERKRAEEALQVSEERFRFALSNSPIVVATLDRDLRYTWVYNPMGGYKPEEILGKKIGLSTDPEVAENIDKLLHQVLTNGESVKFEATSRGSAGDIFFESHAEPLRNAKGEITGVAFVSINITDRKKGEEDLKQSERKFKSLSVNAPDVIMRFDPNLRISYLNPQVERATGIPVEKWIGKTSEEMGMSPELCKLWNDMFHKAESSKQLQQAEFDFPSPDGTRTFSLRIVPEFAEDGSLTSFLGISHDITDLKRVEEQLRKARDELELRVEERTKELRNATEAVKAERKRFYDVLERLPAYLVLLTPDYHVNYANKFFRERFGEDKGRRCFEYLFNRSEPCETCETYKTLKKMGPLEWEWTGPDGHNYYIYDSPFTDVDGTTLIMEVGIDITERKKAEAALQTERKRLFDVLEGLPNMVSLLTPDYHVAFANRSFREMFGESLGRHCYEYCYGQAQPCEFCQSYDVLKTGKPHHWEVTTKDGHVIDVHDFPFTDVDGSPLILEVDIDITERKKAQEALQKAHDELENRVEERTKELVNSTWKLQAEVNERKKAEEDLRETRNYLENLIDYANAPIIVWESGYHITRFNHAFELLTGLRAEEVLGKSLEILFPEGSKQDSLKYIHQAASGTRWETVEIPVLRTDGSVRKVLWNSANILGKDGTTVVATIAQGEDITERKQALESLRESQKDLNRAQAVAMTGSWRLDAQNNILRWSDETYRMFGIPKGTPESYETFLSFVHPDDREFVDSKWQAATRGEPYDIEHRIIADGKVKWVREKAELEFDKNGGFLGGFGTVQDVTEKREMHDKLEEYSKRLEQLVEQKTQELKEAQRLVTIGETAGMVGHDIRNPLQSIEGAVYLAREELKTLPDNSSEKKELHQILEMIRNQTNYIDHIVADLQDFSRTPMPQLRKTSLHELIIEALSTTEIPENIQIETLIQDDLKAVIVDSVFMKRVFLNLIENAVHAMHKGGKLTIRAFDEDRCTCIHVEDTGTGITEEDKPKIFTPLFTTKSKGQGFGLAVCKKLVEAHNGEIAFESELGKGTMFKIKLPQRKEAI